MTPVPAPPAGFACLRLARPDKGNALSAGAVEELALQFATASADPSVHTIALVAQGRHFCTGFDLSDLDSSTDASLLERFVRVELLLDAIWRSPVRTVALAQGRCWGAGADLFAACDLRLCAADTEFRFPGAGFGLVLGTRRLGLRVGRDLARRLTCEGQSLDAAQAVQCGLASAPSDPDPSRFWEHLSAPPVERSTVQRLRQATQDDGADHDLAALVRSAAVPGLKQRITDYRARGQAARATTRPA